MADFTVLDRAFDIADRQGPEGKLQSTECYGRLNDMWSAFAPNLVPNVSNPIDSFIDSVYMSHQMDYDIISVEGGEAKLVTQKKLSRNPNEVNTLWMKVR